MIRVKISEFEKEFMKFIKTNNMEVVEWKILNFYYLLSLYW